MGGGVTTNVSEGCLPFLGQPMLSLRLARMTCSSPLAGSSTRLSFAHDYHNCRDPQQPVKLTSHCKHTSAMAAQGPKKRRRQSHSDGELHNPVAGDSKTTQTPNRSSVGAFNNADSYQQHLTPAARKTLVARPFKSTKCTMYSSPRDHIYNSMARRGDSRMAQTASNADSHQKHMALAPRKSLIVILPLKSSKRQRDPKAPSSD